MILAGDLGETGSRERDVVVVDDPRPRWPGEGGPRRIVLLVLLYDHSFAPAGMGHAEALAWARAGGLLAADEIRLDPAPFPDIAAWCADRVRGAVARLAVEREPASSSPVTCTRRAPTASTACASRRSRSVTRASIAPGSRPTRTSARSCPTHLLALPGPADRFSAANERPRFGALARALPGPRAPGYPAPMSRAEVYAEFLRAEGYRPVLDDAGDLVFKCDGRYYFVTVDDDDPLYFRLVFPNFWGLESEAERHRARVVAAEITAEFKVVKVYPQHDDMQAAAELFLPSEADFRLVFARCLIALRSAVRRFCELMERGPRLRLVEET